MIPFKESNCNIILFCDGVRELFCQVAIFFQAFTIVVTYLNYTLVTQLVTCKSEAMQWNFVIFKLELRETCTFLPLGDKLITATSSRLEWYFTNSLKQYVILTHVIENNMQYFFIYRTKKKKHKQQKI